MADSFNIIVCSVCAAGEIYCCITAIPSSSLVNHDLPNFKICGD